MDCSVLLTQAFILRWKRDLVAHNNCTWVAHRYGQYLHCSLIYFWVPSSCLRKWSASLWGEIIRSAVSASRGRLHYPRRRRWWLHTDWQTALMCNRRRPAATSSRRFPALASITPSCILHQARQHHADASCMSVVPRSPASVLWHFCRADTR